MQHVCCIDVVGTWTEFSPPVPCQQASSIQGRQCFFFCYYSLELRTALQGADTSSEGYVMICMFWSWRMNIRCYGIGVWQIISPIQHLGNVTGLPEPLHRQMYDGRRLFLVDFPWFLFQIRCTRGLLLECLIWKGTIWNDCLTDGFLLCSNSRLSVPSLIHFKSRDVVSLEAISVRLMPYCLLLTFYLAGYFLPICPIIEEEKAVRLYYIVSWVKGPWQLEAHAPSRSPPLMQMVKAENVISD